MTTPSELKKDFDEIMGVLVRHARLRGFHSYIDASSTTLTIKDPEAEGQPSIHVEGDFQRLDSGDYQWRCRFCCDIGYVPMHEFPRISQIFTLIQTFFESFERLQDRTVFKAEEMGDLA